jgi:predicted nucleic acid-binding protein
MRSPIIMFCDTNAIFGIYRAVAVYNSNLKFSVLKKFIDKHNVYISEFVLEELERITLRQHIPFDTTYLKKLFSYCSLKVTISIRTEHFHLLKYVSDPDDAQILHDALSISADYILTSNIKDFNISLIEQDFGCKVINSLNQVK